MEIRNETEIQLLKILFKTNGSKATKNITSRRTYPHGIENKYYRKLKGFFQPLIDYVESYLDKNMEALLKGDSKEFNIDSIPGKTFRNMIFNMENWLSIYMPDISELPADSNNNVILTSIGQTANEAKEFGDKEFNKAIEKGIHVNLPLSSPWWNDMKSSWAEDNYTLITSNAKNYVSKINTLTEQAIVNGLSPAKLSDEIRKATTGLSDKHCKLLARDQMGKLNGQITQAQMEEIGLDLYVWSTAYDDRVRDSHAIMEGLLCRWDDASLCSYDNGKTWVNRPSGAIDLHPGQDIQCRCVALAFYPELEAEMEGIPMQDYLNSSGSSEIPPVQDLPQFSSEKLNKYPKYIQDNIEELKKEFTYVGIPEKSFTEQIFNLIADGGVNPDFKPNSLTSKNCQRCVPALQMKMKGFNVTALPLPSDNPPLTDMFWDKNWTSWLKEKDGSPAKSTSVWFDYLSKINSSTPINQIKLEPDVIKKHLIEQIKNSPEGSMFELRCSWQIGGDGHVFSAFSGGKKGVIFYDPQTNSYGDSLIDDYLQNMVLDSLEIVRTDDKIIDISRIKEACKNKQ